MPKPWEIVTHRKSAPPRGKRRDYGRTLRMREKWKDPEYRAKMLACLRSKKGVRTGIPDGMHREDADKAWDEARQKADYVMSELEKTGAVPSITVPDSDEDKAKKALHELCVIGFGPTALRERITSLKTVLEFTKQKPVQKIDQKISSAEAFLADALADLKNDDGPDGATKAS